METVLHTFVGIRTGNLRTTTYTHCYESTEAQNQSCCSDFILAEAFEKHLRSRKGFLGVGQAVEAIYEPQGRGALHMHGMVWTMLNAEVLSVCNRTQLNNLCKVIDRLIATSIHPKDVQEEKLTNNDTQVEQRCALRNIPQNMTLLKMGNFSKKIMYRCQNHDKCSFTCFSKKKFQEKCRFAKPSKKCSKTTVSTLKLTYNESGEVIIPQRVAIIEKPPAIGSLSIPVPTKQVQWVDHKRVTHTDRNLIDGNMFLTASLGWNSCINLIAAAGSAQSSIYYISRYMSKSPTKPTTILPLVYSAISKRKLYPSKAKD